MAETFRAIIADKQDGKTVASIREIGLGDLPDEDVREIDTFVMLRRMALLAWIGSHIDAPEPQAMAPHFARVTADLASDYLARMR